MAGPSPSTALRNLGLGQRNKAAPRNNSPKDTPKTTEADSAAVSNRSSASFCPPQPTVTKSAVALQQGEQQVLRLIEQVPKNSLFRLIDDLTALGRDIRRWSETLYWYCPFLPYTDTACELLGATWEC
jgi:hypothetical protein